MKNIVSGILGGVVIAGVSFAEPTHVGKTDWTLNVGAALLAAPAFEGADETQTMLVPDLRLMYRDVFFASLPEGVGYNAINTEAWKIGPIAKLNMGRDENGENPFLLGDETNALRGMGDVDAALELGGFAEYQGAKLRPRLEVRQALSGHEGVVAEARVAYADNAGPIFYSVGPRAKWASENYTQSFFGVNTTQAARKGITQYSADAGLVSYGVGGMARMPIAANVALTGFAGYDLMGDVATDSSFIKQEGEANQFVVGAGLSYKFGWDHR
jgi:MipA family protein